MNKPISTSGESLEHGRAIVFRNGIVLTMDDGNHVLHDSDVLVVDGVIAEVGPGIKAPDGALEIDARAASSCRA
jgi:5-methylthioadenosine/S-adenosylhomocysteine deaminase